MATSFAVAVSNSRRIAAPIAKGEEPAIGRKRRCDIPAQVQIRLAAAAQFE